MNNIILGKHYKILGKSKYFIKKYETENPIARIDKGPFIMEGVNKQNSEDWARIFNEKVYLVGVCAGLYYHRAMEENLPLDGCFYYSHIQNNGELVHDSEIGPLNSFDDLTRNSDHSREEMEEVFKSNPAFVRALLKETERGFRQFLEMSNLGLVKTYYTPKNHLYGFSRILSHPFIVNEIYESDSIKRYKIHIIHENEDIDVDFKEFIKYLTDVSLSIATFKSIRTNIMLILLEFEENLNINK